MSSWPDAPLPIAPAEPLDADGAPRLGAYAGSFDRVELARAAGGGAAGALRRAGREKRWQYALVATDEVLAAAAVVEAGLFGGAFFWAADRAAGTVLAERSASGLPRLQARVNDRPGAGARASWASPGLSVRIERRSDRWRFVAEAGEARLDALLDTRGAPAPFALVVPVPGGGVRVTQKCGALAASGTLRVGGRAFALEGGTGGLDATYGLLARETAWRWAYGTGRLPGGAPIAFNLAAGFAGVPDGDPGENALLLAGATSRLPPVAFTFDPAAPLSPWRVASADGALELAFRPEAAHREDRDLVLVKTRFAQVAGSFEGRLPAPGGGTVAVAGLPGVVEDHWALW